MATDSKPTRKMIERRPFGNTGLSVPSVIFGTSSLGNLFREVPFADKRAIVEEVLRCVSAPAVLDSAGKYGAGLALEMLGRILRELGFQPDQVILSNKLGWKRVPLSGPEPTFEPGAWVGLEHDARQDIGYDGILNCWRQGCELLGEPYRPQLVSVHDPDEYLAQAQSTSQRDERFGQILDAYRALHELKCDGRARAVGVGSKDWTVIRDLAGEVELDWVMLACSLTVYSHPSELLTFLASLYRRGVAIINSAVFHSGFLTGGAYFDYVQVDPTRDAGKFAWRERFFELCQRHDVTPAAACVQFGLSAPGVVSIAMNTTRPERVAECVGLVTAPISQDFWADMKAQGLIAKDYPYLAAGE